MDMRGRLNGGLRASTVRAMRTWLMIRLRLVSHLLLALIQEGHADDARDVAIKGCHVIRQHAGDAQSVLA